MGNTIEIYKSPDQKIELKVNLDNDTVWLSQEQLVILFDRDQSVVSRHIRNVFKEQELDEESNMQKMHIPNSDRPVSFYNLDVIISLGYRVKSQRGTQFRQWATHRLKEYLVEGVAINEKRLVQKNQEIKILHDGIRILSRAIEAKANLEDHNWLLEFSEGLKLLDDYDHEQLDKTGNHNTLLTYPAREDYMTIVDRMRKDFNTTVFGKLKDSGFDSAIGQIKQGLGKKDIYPSIEEKAAMLLYLIVKNHAFVDGNKHIAAACFLLFLERNKLLFDKHGNAILSNEALASITLLVASSKSDEMETMKKLIISILNRNNAYV